ncbi:NAD(P)/FAD-dependent oxidoreductase [Roseiconus nitratireducens]|uniref:NAD(P)/FAD-dependent oxidoreductase n=1 Tax=Roseiconus nitratireducens TaxID=2605748 RepID=UPI001375F52D|nr:tryptophan 7-halogenase [Roseiconus nitratireducens]
MTRDSFDVLIVGSGFSGSILARILATAGRKVVLVDSVAHPRFAIGESSTPIADRLLAAIGQRYRLADLIQLSCYGSWQSQFPQLACGKKRGFSYFDHREPGGERASPPGKSSIPDGQRPESQLGERSLLVAASPNDERSDTHWYRSDVDHFLFQRAKDAGVQCLETCEVVEFCPGEPNRIRMADGRVLIADQVVDASGRSAVTARLLDRPDWTVRLRTRTCCSFSHYENVSSFSNHFDRMHQDRRATVPFDADDAAQHHLVDGGWVWMLRMNNGITSIGCTLTGDHPASVARSQRLMESRFEDYPAIHAVLQCARPSEAIGVRSIGRLQHFRNPMVAPTCWMLPTTAATLDPLHSTGIAHALAGVHRLARLILQGPTQSAIDEYQSVVVGELLHLDRLIQLAYSAMASFARFEAACMIYFAAAIHTEERLQAGELPRTFWLADDDRFVAMVARAEQWIVSGAPDGEVVGAVRRLLEPFNQIGLLHEDVHRRYAYTATK